MSAHVENTGVKNAVERRSVGVFFFSGPAQSSDLAMHVFWFTYIASLTYMKLFKYNFVLNRCSNNIQFWSES